MWTYAQRTGELLHDGAFEGSGYSGRAGGRNNPDAQAIRDTGPVPEGFYSIGEAFDHPRLGPCVMPLYPEPGTNTFGRSAFYIHGDNARHDASHGCIILGPAIRQRVAADSDCKLTVIAG